MYPLPKQRRYLAGNLVAHRTKDGHDCLVRAGGLGRIGKAEMDAFPLPQPDRALFRCRVAYSHHQIERYAAELVGVFGSPGVRRALG